MPKNLQKLLRKDLDIFGLLGLQSRLPCTDPNSGLRPEMRKKWPKNGVWPHRQKGKKWSKMLTHFWPIFAHFSAIFPPFPGGAKIHFSANSFPFQAGGLNWGLNRATGIATLGRRFCWQLSPMCASYKAKVPE